MKIINKISIKAFLILAIFELGLMIFSSSILAKYSSESNIALSVNINGDYSVIEADNTVTITKYLGLGGNIVIPSSLNNKPVVIIGASAFSNNQTITNVVFPSTITLIDENAFYNCKALVGELKLPSSLQTIGANAFNNCTGLYGNLVIPFNVTTIEDSAFLGCSNINGSLSLPNKLVTIGNSAFNRCAKLSGNLVIPSNVESIGYSAFYGCSRF